jgi:alpha-galactosidase
MSILAVADQMSASLGVHPQMGWNSWNKYNCSISSDIIKTNADKMGELGLVYLGYEYLNIDDCWMAP